MKTSDIKKDQKSFKPITSHTKKGAWNIYPELCKGCGLCIEVCPTEVISFSKDLGAYGTQRVQCRAEGCITCGLCANICPDCAIMVRIKNN